MTITNEDISRGVILEVKDYVGLGKTYDVILYDGVIKSEDIVLALDIDGVQQSRLKSILKPSELKEIGILLLNLKLLRKFMRLLVLN